MKTTIKKKKENNFIINLYFNNYFNKIFFVIKIFHINCLYHFLIFLRKIKIRLNKRKKYLYPKLKKILLN